MGELPESKVGESKHEEGSRVSMENKGLKKIMAKRERGDVLAQLYPFYQRKISDGMDEFYEKYVHEFDFESDEHRLCYTDIFQQYEKLFEGYLREFIEERQLDEEIFYQELNEMIESSGTGRSKILVKLLAAQTDFDFFVNLMKDKAKELAQSKDESSQESGKYSKK